MANVIQLIREHRRVGLDDNPQFDKAHRLDWRNYVPDDIREVWKDLSVESRVMIYVMAERLVNNENWD